MRKIVYYSNFRKFRKKLEQALLIRFDFILERLHIKDKEKFNLIRIIRKKFTPYKTDIRNTPHIYLTLKCNLRCPYCANGKYYDKSSMGYEEKSSDFWINKINSMNQKSIIFTGGEPLLYLDLFKIINNIKQKNILIYSNISIKNFEQLLNKKKKSCRWWLSYHPGGGADLKLILKNISSLKKYREYFTLHLIPAEENKKYLNKYNQYLFKSHKVDLNVNNFVMRQLDTENQTVKCKFSGLYYGPDGNRYHCIYGMIKKNSEYIVKHNNFESVKICNSYGECSPCDYLVEVEFIH